MTNSNTKAGSDGCSCGFWPCRHHPTHTSAPSDGNPPQEAEKLTGVKSDGAQAPSDSIDEILATHDHKRDLNGVLQNRYFTKRRIQALIDAARVNELRNCCDECGFWHNPNPKHGIAQTFKERIAQLTKNNSEVKKGV